MRIGVLTATVLRFMCRSAAFAMLVEGWQEAHVLTMVDGLILRNAEEKKQRKKRRVI